MINKEIIDNAASKHACSQYDPATLWKWKGDLWTQANDSFIEGAYFAVEQLSEKVYSEADMYIIIQHIFKTTTFDVSFGGNTSFKELYTYFINNKEKILHGNQ